MKVQDQKIVDKIHDYEYEMLCKLDDVCRKNNITYFMEAGTLIGAARHKDFIPWDDDIDIYFKRKDFEKLLAHKDELAPYRVHIPDGKDGYFWDYTTRMIDERVSIKKDDREARFYDHNNCDHLFMDLFVMDNNPGGIRGKLHIFYLKLLYVFGTSRRYNLTYDVPANPFARFAVYILCRIGIFIPLKRLFAWYEKVSQMYNKNKKCKYYVLSNVSATYISDSVYKKEWYKKKVELPLRDRKFFAPAGYDASLRSYYGDYTQFPPEREQFPDHIDYLDDIKFEGVPARSMDL